MADAAQTEFWRDLKPIEKVFQTHSLPEMFTPKIATDDDRYYVPLSETVGTRPVWISVSQNSWCDVLRATGVGLHQYIDICKEHYEKVGLGADYIDTLLR
jgi:2,4'-dihydroxyacetophenone dioxygenase